MRLDSPTPAASSMKMMVAMSDESEDGEELLSSRVMSTMSQTDLGMSHTDSTEAQNCVSFD